MMGVWRVLMRVSRVWWRAWLGMVLLNVLWLVLQLPIVTGPPATAVLYVLARKMHEDEVWALPEMWGLLRRLFWPAWRWALLNGVLLFVLGWNVYAFGAASGWVWEVLRWVWWVLLGLVFLLNLFFWPFWLAQSEKSLWLTYANCGRLLLSRPFLVLFVGGMAVLLGVIGLRVLVLLSAGGVVWLVLLGEAAVQEALAVSSRKG